MLSNIPVIFVMMLECSLANILFTYQILYVKILYQEKLISFVFGTLHKIASI